VVSGHRLRQDRHVRTPTFDDGALAASYAAVDWAATPLGPPEQWSQALRWSVDLVRHTRFPVTLLWGPELVLLYNEAYVGLIADRHPAALGRPCREVFPEAWDTIGPMLREVLAGGEATWSEDVMLPLLGDGVLQERWFSFSYSAVRGAGGVVEGVIDITTESTQKIVTARRLASLAGLNHRLSSTDTVEGLAAAAVQVLSGLGDDVAAADLVDPSGRSLAPTGPRDPRLPTGPAPAQREVVLAVDDDSRRALARIPVRTADGRHELTLLLVMNPMLPLDADVLEFARLLGWALSQHLERVVTLQTEHELSRALQAALLSRPRHSAAYDIAVHYQPAQSLAQVGGDWYDVFPRTDGATMVAVGDVIGHDHGAAAAMGQIRNLVRGLAHLERTSPSSVVASLELAMSGLAVETLATAVVGDLRERPDGRATFTWTNAGHLPPVLVDPSGATRLLEREPNAMIGIGTGAAAGRYDHEVALPAGSTLVLYTDGLVERRHESLDLGFERLLEHLSGCAGMTASEVCSHALAVLDDLEQTEDDVALMVVRVRS
jgi:serine phosphatase RsbU (regulator of sigma subunit)